MNPSWHRERACAYGSDVLSLVPAPLERDHDGITPVSGPHPLVTNGRRVDHRGEGLVLAPPYSVGAGILGALMAVAEARQCASLVAWVCIPAPARPACTSANNDTSVPNVESETSSEPTTAETAKPSSTELTPSPPPNTEATEAPTSPRSIPPALVGAWCGGSNSSADDTWIFAPGGSFTAGEQVPLSGITRLSDHPTLSPYTDGIGVHQREIAMDEDTVLPPMFSLLTATATSTASVDERDAVR